MGNDIQSSSNYWAAHVGKADGHRQQTRTISLFLDRHKVVHVIYS